jgi:hypothetical protein
VRVVADATGFLSEKRKERDEERFVFERPPGVGFGPPSTLLAFSPPPTTTIHNKKNTKSFGFEKKEQSETRASFVVWPLFSRSPLNPNRPCPRPHTTHAFVGATEAVRTTQQQQQRVLLYPTTTTLSHNNTCEQTKQHFFCARGVW